MAAAVLGVLLFITHLERCCFTEVYPCAKAVIYLALRYQAGLAHNRGTPIMCALQARIALLS
jgi:hypothetical protein